MFSRLAEKFYLLDRSRLRFSGGRTYTTPEDTNQAVSCVHDLPVHDTLRTLAGFRKRVRLPSDGIKHDPCAYSVRRVPFANRTSDDVAFLAYISRRRNQYPYNRRGGK